MLSTNYTALIEINKKCGGQFIIENGKYYDSARIEISLVVKNDSGLVLKRMREILTDSTYRPIVEVQIRRGAVWSVKTNIEKPYICQR
jgi:hypothetical protein